MNSPLCRDAAGELAGAAARNCQASGFEGAQAPTGDYGMDVHISTGLANLGIGNDVSAIVQELLQIWWAAMVAVVRGVIVVLDWCYTLDLLNSPAMSGVARGLRETQATFTEPWMAIALAIAAVAALYHGLIRRRVAQTLGEALVMVAMMAGGLWVIVNPTGTIGALGAWANEASLGTLAAVRAGSAEHPYRTLGESDRELFGAAIDAPWCFVEFGNVSWCEAPVQPRLRKAALKLAAQAKAGGEGGAGGGVKSLPRKALEGSLKLIEGAMGASEEPEALHVSLQSAALLRSASTNGALFLALPANGPARNSLGDSQSLYYVLCGGSEEPCQGPTAGEADFRTSSGTWSRGIGLTLVAFGVLGMLLLLGYIAWRLLYAAFMSLIYLLLTPVAVLAPTLGENGRAAFRTWAMRLLAAVTSKLIYSLLLGAVLMVQHALSDIHMFGWLTQWLLLSSLWWIVYLRRNRLFEFATGGTRGGAAGAQQRSVLRRVSDVLESRKGVSATRWARRRLSKPAPSVDRLRTLAQAGRERAQDIGGEQVQRMLEHDYEEAHEIVREAPEIEARIAANSARLKEMEGEHAAARGRADEAKHAEKMALTDRKVALSQRKDNAAPFRAEAESQQRHAAELHGEMGHLQKEIARDRGSLDNARQTAQDGDRVKERTGGLFTLVQAEARERLLDAQAALPPKERDYARLATLTKYGRRQYEAMDEDGQRDVQLEVDRELATRRGAAVAAREISAGEEGSLNLREQRDLNRRFDGTLEQAVKAEGHDLPAELRPQPKRSRADAPRHRGSGGGGSGGAASKSSVMRDLHEAQARHKRQLGSGRR